MQRTTYGYIFLNSFSRAIQIYIQLSEIFGKKFAEMQQIAQLFVTVT